MAASVSQALLTPDVIPITTYHATKKLELFLYSIELIIFGINYGYINIQTDFIKCITEINMIVDTDEDMEHLINDSTNGSSLSSLEVLNKNFEIKTSSAPASVPVSVPASVPASAQTSAHTSAQPSASAAEFVPEWKRISGTFLRKFHPIHKINEFYDNIKRVFAEISNSSLYTQPDNILEVLHEIVLVCNNELDALYNILEKEMLNKTNDFKIVSFNVCKDANCGEFTLQRYQMICNLLVTGEADIYLIQEITDDLYLMMFNNHRLSMNYHIYYSPHTEGAILMNRRLFKNYETSYSPILDTENPELIKYLKIDYIDAVLYDNTRLALINVHLPPPFFYLGSQPNYRKSYKQHFFELLKLVSIINIPIILGGDFNNGSCPMMSNDVVNSEKEDYVLPYFLSVMNHYSTTKATITLSIKKLLIKCIRILYSTDTEVKRQFVILNSFTTKDDPPNSSYADEKRAFSIPVLINLRGLPTYYSEKEKRKTDITGVNLFFDKVFVSPEICNVKEVISSRWVRYTPSIDKLQYDFGRLFASEKKSVLEKKISAITQGLPPLRRPTCDKSFFSGTNSIWPSDHYAISYRIPNKFKSNMDKHLKAHTITNMFLYLKEKNSGECNKLFCGENGTLHNPERPFGLSTGDKFLRYIKYINTKEDALVFAKSDDSQILFYSDRLWLLKEYLTEMCYRMFQHIAMNSKETCTNCVLLTEILENDIYIALLKFNRAHSGEMTVFSSLRFYKDLTQNLNRRVESIRVKSIISLGSAVTASAVLASSVSSNMEFVEHHNTRLILLQQLVKEQYPQQAVSLRTTAPSRVVNETEYKCNCKIPPHNLKRDSNGRLGCVINGKVKIISAPAPAPAPAPASVKDYCTCGIDSWKDGAAAAGSKTCTGCGKPPQSGGSHRLTNKRLYKNLLKLSQ
uniref:Endonuclease/exonuclease/phosphatase domain-containing protein n=1 Tax=viral metagenome TaxID=1070528 RepID=A0A6C0E025_9ZZZZ